jgi:pSer/pThr/pTyr-binding forkhead associated (FHA) protein
VRGRPDELHAGSPRELKDRAEAERRGSSFIFYRDDHGRQHLLDLGGRRGRLTIGRHPASDIALPWDGEVSRLHAELEQVAGEWTVVDDGRSRNGTFVNGVRLLGRRLLADADVIRAGRALLVFRSPARRQFRSTFPQALVAPVLSPAQRRVLVALCRPFAGSHRFATPASNRAIAQELVVSSDTVKSHMRALFDAFGIGPMPQNEKRATLAREALERGVVTPREL